MKKQFGSGGTPRGLTIQTGSRGGKYHITASGNKSYTPLSDKKQLHVVDGQLTTADEVNALAKKHGVSHHSQIPGYQGEYGAGGKKQKIAPPPPPKPVPPPRPAKPVPPPKPVPVPPPKPNKAALPPKPPPRPVPPPAPPKPVMPDPAKLFNEPPPKKVSAGVAHLIRSDVPGAEKEVLTALRKAGLEHTLGKVNNIHIMRGRDSDVTGGTCYTMIHRDTRAVLGIRMELNAAWSKKLAEGAPIMEVSGRGRDAFAFDTGKRKGPFVMGKYHVVHPNGDSGVSGLGSTAIHEASHAWMHTEYGHGSAVYEGKIRPAHRKAVALDKAVSRYAKVNADEWFAETHTAYVLHGEALKAYHPESWQLIHDLRRQSGME